MLGLVWLLMAPAGLAATNLISPDEIPPLRPPRPELPPGFWEQHGVAAAIIGAGLLMLAAAAIWFLTRPKPPVLVPPALRARQALAPLQSRLENGALLSRVSQVLRHYVTEAFEMPREELTTAEFCRALIHLDRMGPPVSVPLTDFLRQCDRHKFAPHPAAPPPLEAVAQALRLVELCEARLAQLRQPPSVSATPRSGETRVPQNQQPGPAQA